MSNLPNHVRSMIIGMITSGVRQKVIAQRLGIHRHTVRNTILRLCQTVTVTELPRSGRPRVTTARDDLLIRTSHLRNRVVSDTFTARNLPNAAFQTDCKKSSQSVNIQTYTPSKQVTLSDRHKRAIHTKALY